jgi:hypothetical protein
MGCVHVLTGTFTLTAVALHRGCRGYAPDPVLRFGKALASSAGWEYATRPSFENRWVYHKLPSSCIPVHLPNTREQSAQETVQSWPIHSSCPRNSNKKALRAGLMARLSSCCLYRTGPCCSFEGLFINRLAWVLGLLGSSSLADPFSERPYRHYLIPLNWLPFAKIDH